METTIEANTIPNEDQIAESTGGPGWGEDFIEGMTFKVLIRFLTVFLFTGFLLGIAVLALIHVIFTHDFGFHLLSCLVTIACCLFTIFRSFHALETYREDPKQNG
jgi:hypothetical protein